MMQEVRQTLSKDALVLCPMTLLPAHIAKQPRREPLLFPLDVSGLRYDCNCFLLPLFLKQVRLSII
jgi:hypothetical protein